jgi:hypothetical protein
VDDYWNHNAAYHPWLIDTAATSWMWVVVKAFWRSG